MVKPKDKKSVWEKWLGAPAVKQGKDFCWTHRLSLLVGCLLILGILLAFFVPGWGGFCAGLSFGMCFFDEIKSYFLKLRDRYFDWGPFKTWILVGSVVYLLVALPWYILSIAIGFGLYALLLYVFRSPLR